MKKINKYLYAFLFLLVAFFVTSNNVALAEGEDEEQEEVIADKDLDQNDVYVVLNPGSSTGEAQLKVNNVQYTTARDIHIKVNIDKIKELKEGEDPFDLNEKFEVCEVDSATSSNQEKCIQYYVEDDSNRFQLRSAKDGKKTIEIYFYNTETTVGKKNSAVRKVVKEIVLDTTGPVITIEGGEYVYIPKGDTYKEKGASCVDDSGVVVGECAVTVEKTTIDLKKAGYQYVRYTAVDYFGNEVNVVKKVLVDTTTEEESNGWTTWLWIGGGIAILSALLFLQVWKNKEKQKNQSVL